MKNQMSGFQDELTGSLIGLAKACKMNIRQAAVTRLLMEGLITTIKDAGFYDQAVADMLKKVKKEKNRIAPGCAICKSVCGNTSDYDIKNIWTCDEEIRLLKLLILSGIKGIAVYALPVMEKGYENDKINEFFYKALSIISYDLTMEDLLPVVAETAEMNQICNNIRQAGLFIAIPDYESMYEFFTPKILAMLKENYHISLIPMPKEDLKKITDQLTFH
ncbi:MAG: hydroxylamine reductase [Lacrimispora sp.]|nr:hydroxylamine reductase [Lacrimispora sp.]